MVFGEMFIFTIFGDVIPNVLYSQKTYISSCPSIILELNPFGKRNKIE
jgi:hypothetical protein